MRTLVLGIGNPILLDDGVGPRVVTEAGKRWLGAGVDFETTFQVGMALVDQITGYDRLIVVDSIRTGSEPGRLTWLEPADFEVRDVPPSEHNVGILQALKLAGSLGIPVPGEVRLLTVEALDVTNFGEGLTPAVEEAVPAAVRQLIACLSRSPVDLPAGTGAGTNERERA